MSKKALQAFGREVRRRREALGMSLPALEAGSGLTANYISSVELAMRPRGLSLDAALRLARGLGVELPDLLGFKGFKGPAVEAARLVEALPERTQEAALVVLRALQDTTEVTR